MVASALHNTGYVEICSVCVLTEGRLVGRTIRQCSKDVLIRQLFIPNNTSHSKTEQRPAVPQSQGCVVMIC